VSAVDLGAAPAPSMDEIWHVVEGVWESMLGCWPAPAEPGEVGADWLTAVITVTGEWSGTVRFSCPPSTARHVGRAMLELTGEEPDPEPEDVEDAVREVVNVLGGNIKALVPGGRSLGLPVLTHGAPAVDGSLVGTLGVSWPGHVAHVDVWHRDPAEQSSPNHQHTDQK
jgi:chemotaxis protein CheX